MANWILGLTGGIGAGKSTVSAMFKNLGVDVVDADIIAREVVAKDSDGLAAIATHFGNDILLPDGNLNRPALREHIFANPTEKAWLNALLHPMIREITLRRLAETQSTYAILEAPLLFENNLDKYCQHTLLIDVPEDVQLARTTRRDGVNEAQVKAIIAAQMPRSEKRAKADDIVENGGSPEALQEIIKTLHLKYLQLAKVAI